MKIAYLCCEKLDLPNAIPIHVSEICEGLTKKGHLVHLYSPYRNTFTFFVNYSVFTGLLSTHSLFCLIENIWFYKILRKKIKAYDLIYCRFYRRFWAPLLLSKVSKIPLVNEVNEIYRFERELEKNVLTNYSWYKRLLNFIIMDRISNLIERFIHNAANLSISVTPEISNDLINHFKLKPKIVKTISNGVNEHLFFPMDKNLCRKELGLESDIFYLGFIGHIEYYQGIDKLIKSTKIFFQNTQKTKLIIIGSGPYTNDVKKLISELGLNDRILMVPAVKAEESPKWINCFDLGILLKIPIDSGISPLKLYAMLACNIPVLASDIPSFRILSENGVGYLVTYPENEGGCQKVAEKMLEIYKMETLNPDKSQKRRDYVIKNFTWSDTVQKTEKYMKQIISESTHIT